MNNLKEIYQALIDGKMLTDGISKVRLNEEGFQVNEAGLKYHTPINFNCPERWWPTYLKKKFFDDEGNLNEVS